MKIMKGKLIVIEGTDASGKSTQFSMLCGNLEKTGVSFKKVVFPQYDKPSSALIHMYLNGEFGTKPDDVNAYAASTFYAVDRYASFKKEWSGYYKSGGLILCDRYTTSNAIHQASKLSGEEREKYLEWLFGFEYELMGLPRPDCVIFLDMPPKYAQMLLKNREGKTMDIHEKDAEYLKRCYDSSLNLCEKYGWVRIPCTESGEICGKELIQEKILNAIKDVLNK